MTDAVATTQETKPASRQEYESALLEQVVVMGDLAKLTPEQRVIYYRSVCESLGLNPLTRPFDYLVLNGALRLYANKTCTDQLRSTRGIGIDSVDHAEVGDLYIATVHGHDRTGRKDTEVGAVDIANLKGERRANAIMKSITKAKRRLTLSLAGLGWLDDTEVGSIADAEPVDVDPETGEVREEPTITDTIAAKRAAITSGSDGPERDAEDAVTSSTDEPPHPAEAGARASTPSHPGNDDSGRTADAGAEPAPAEVAPPDAQSSAHDASPAAQGSDSAATRCEGFSAELGACTREKGHEGNHANKDKETWR